jgi:hypothetical protein
MPDVDMDAPASTTQPSSIEAAASAMQALVAIAFAVPRAMPRPVIR